jgi:hypothetical protein
MKKIYALPILMLICLLTLFGFKSDENWQLYTSTAGHFTIEFPGNPVESVDNSKTDAGKEFTMNTASYSPSDSEVYMVSWIDMHNILPKDKTIEQMLTDSRDGATNSMKVKNVVTLKMNLEENPYIEFTFETDDYVGKYRIYIINENQLSIITIFSKEVGIKSIADKFIQSFKIIN